MNDDLMFDMDDKPKNNDLNSDLLMDEVTEFQEMEKKVMSLEVSQEELLAI